MQRVKNQFVLLAALLILSPIYLSAQVKTGADALGTRSYDDYEKPELCAELPAITIFINSGSKQ